ncbi:helix-turn-helix domain-containing protein [Kocuria rosea]|uniref:helix-turn-helix domain-containing protein n=1 Tax=Kocuria rosea TaxID=1275 RepID=UPI00232DA79A|nr:helix-turn-helix domain-containing protein [Kocuria rosea]
MASLAAGGTTSGAQSTADTRSTQDAGALVAELKAESGLTADQLGRLLGVTRRSIHNWAAGSPIAPKHEPRVRALSELVFGLDATTPEGRRELMLDSSSGPSRFKIFLSSTPRSERIQHHIPVGERFEQ